MKGLAAKDFAVKERPSVLIPMNSSRPGQIEILANTRYWILPESLDTIDSDSRYVQNQLLSQGVPEIHRYDVGVGNELRFLIHLTKNPALKSKIKSAFISPATPGSVIVETSEQLFVPGMKHEERLSSTAILTCFCRQSRFLHLQPGVFVTPVAGFYANELGQVLFTNFETGIVLVRFVPRIDYENMEKFHVTTQTACDKLLGKTYRAPHNLFDPLWFKSRNIPLKMECVAQGETRCTVAEWDGRAFTGSGMLLVRLSMVCVKAVSRLTQSDWEMFKSHVSPDEAKVPKFRENMARQGELLLPHRSEMETLRELIESDRFEYRESTEEQNFSFGSSRNADFVPPNFGTPLVTPSFEDLVNRIKKGPDFGDDDPSLYLTFVGEIPESGR